MIAQVADEADHIVGYQAADSPRGVDADHHLAVGLRTNPVDWRNPRSGSTNTPVAAEMALASAEWPTGNVRPCLATSSAVVASSSTERATTLAPTSARLSEALWKARSCALQ